MADDDVQVRFGAAIDGLLAGVEQAKAAIQSVTEPVQAVVASFKELGEAAIAGFAIDKATEFVSQMAELGEQVERTAAILGVSTKSAQELGFVAKITGGSAEGLSMSMERLQVNLQQAQNGTGRAALALRALGLSAHDLIGIPLDQQMNKIADAVAKFADGGNKTAIVMALMGRSGAQMIPVLDQGHQGLNALRQSAEDAGAIMSEHTVKALSSVEHNLVTLRSATQGLGAEFVGHFAEAINAATSALTRLVAGLSDVVKTGHTAEATFHLLALGASILTMNLVNAYLEYQKLKSLLAGSADEAKSMLRIDVDKASPEKPQAPALAVPNTDALKAQAEFMDGQIKGLRDMDKATKLALDEQVKQYQITAGQKYDILRKNAADEVGVEVALLQSKATLYRQDSAEYEKVQSQIAETRRKYALEEQKDQQLANEQAVKDWQSTLQPIESAFNSQLKGLLSGTETFAQAMKNIFSDLVIKIIEGFEKIAFEKLALNLATAFGDPATMFAGAAKAITANVGVVYAGETANLALSLGPAAPAAAAGIAAGVQATALSMAALDVGAWNIPSVMPAMLHPGEMVIPANFASGLRGAGSDSGAGGGDTHVHLHVSAVDGNSVQRFFSQNGPQIARTLSPHLKQPSLNQ